MLKVKILSALLFAFVTAAHADSANWTEKLKVDGDFRARQQYDKHEENAARYKTQLRARLGFSAEVTEEVKVGLKIATGKLGDTATSGNQTIGDNFESKNFALSRAYMSWKPYEAATLTFGKMENPLFRPGQSQLIWDEDLGPEGLAASWDCSCSEEMKHFLNLGAFVMAERYNSSGNPDSNTPDPTIYAAQAGGRYDFSGTKLNWGLGYLNFANTRGGTAIGAFGSNSNNGTVYTHDYELGTLGFEVGMNAGDMPIMFYADIAQNFILEEDNSAYLVGVKAGKLKDKGDMEFGYSFRQVEKDATLAYLNDSDFSGGDDDSKGHGLSFKYAFAPSANLALTYFKSEVGISGTSTEDHDRGHLDFVFKF